MTLLAPGRKGAGSGRPAAPKAPPGPRISLELAPPSQQSVATLDQPVRLSGSARLGAALLLIVGLLLQRTLLPLLPWGPADLVTALVAVLAIYGGPATGCICGFGIGLTADALSDHALGRLAAVLCLVGYLCGLVPTRGAHQWRVAWLTVAVASVATPLLFALTGAFAGDDRAAGSLLLTRCLAGLCYGLLMAPFVYVITRRLLGPRTRHKRRRRLSS
jgi:rod shape-determining protein MreD